MARMSTERAATSVMARTVEARNSASEVDATSTTPWLGLGFSCVT